MDDCHSPAEQCFGADLGMSTAVLCLMKMHVVPVLSSRAG